MKKTTNYYDSKEVLTKINQVNKMRNEGNGLMKNRTNYYDSKEVLTKINQVNKMRNEGVNVSEALKKVHMSMTRYIQINEKMLYHYATDGKVVFEFDDGPMEYVPPKGAILNNMIW